MARRRAPKEIAKADITAFLTQSAMEMEHAVRHGKNDIDDPHGLLAPPTFGVARFDADEPDQDIQQDEVSVVDPFEQAEPAEEEYDQRRRREGYGDYGDDD
jgi:hypothetical protein